MAVKKLIKFFVVWNPPGTQLSDVQSASQYTNKSYDKNHPQKQLNIDGILNQSVEFLPVATAKVEGKLYPTGVPLRCCAKFPSHLFRSPSKRARDGPLRTVAGAGNAAIMSVSLGPFISGAREYLITLNYSVSCPVWTLY